MALGPPHAIAASALRIHPMKTVFVAVTVATIRCRQYVENQEVDHVDAVVAWEWLVAHAEFTGDLGMVKDLLEPAAA